MTIKLSDISTTLGTRQKGQEIRNVIEKHIENGEKIIFDFDGISSISHSFADECFGKLLEKREFIVIKKVTSFINTSPIVSSIILATFNNGIQISV